MRINSSVNGNGHQAAANDRNNNTPNVTSSDVGVAVSRSLSGSSGGGAPQSMLPANPNSSHINSINRLRHRHMMLQQQQSTTTSTTTSSATTDNYEQRVNTTIESASATSIGPRPSMRRNRSDNAFPTCLLSTDMDHLQQDMDRLQQHSNSKSNTTTTSIPTPIDLCPLPSQAQERVVPPPPVPRAITALASSLDSRQMGLAAPPGDMQQPVRPPPAAPQNAAPLFVTPTNHNAAARFSLLQVREIQKTCIFPHFMAFSVILKGHSLSRFITVFFII